MFNLSYISQQNDLVRARLQEEANSQLGFIVDTLIKMLNPSKIIVFGSINEKDKFHRLSDIDIAVSNIKMEKYLQAYGEILSRSCFPIDLVIMEGADENLKKKIVRTGRILYERNG